MVLTIQHATPYFDDSYAVNSENVGPYGDAITQELIPYVEKKFRGIGQGWARAVYGGSTGGWESLASQVFYPDFYNGAWVFCPDVVDFRAYMTTNLYEDKNAFWIESAYASVPRPSMRQAGRACPIDDGADESLRTGAGNARPFRRAIRYMAGRVQFGRRRRIS